MGTKLCFMRTGQPVQEDDVPVAVDLPGQRDRGVLLITAEQMIEHDGSGEVEAHEGAQHARRILGMRIDPGEQHQVSVPAQPFFEVFDHALDLITAVFGDHDVHEAAFPGTELQGQRIDFVAVSFHNGKNSLPRLPVNRFLRVVDDERYHAAGYACELRDHFLRDFCLFHRASG